jgi:MFS transporter, DHA1 family, solute carrier family 18 (vesicular amine transporter), member 1/2
VADEAERPRRGPIAAIAVGAVAIDSALLGLLAPLLPEIQERTGAGDEAVGLALGAYAVPIALLSLPLGRMADRFGRRTLLTAGLLLVAVGSALVAVSDSLEALLAARVVQGAGSAASWIAALALVSDTAPPGRRGEALGAALAATGIGSIAGPALGGVAADVFGFETPFAIAGVLALVLLAAALLVLPREERRPRSAVPALATILRVVRSGPGAWAAVIILASAFVLGLTEVVAPLDLDARLGLSASVIGLLFSASIAVDALFAPLGGRLGDRRGRRLPALSGLALTALSVALLAVLPGVVGTIVALGVYGAGFSLSMAAAIPWLDEAFDERERGLAYGVQNLLYAGGYALGPIVGGALLGAASADFAYLVTAAAMFLVAIALWATEASRRSAAHGGEQHNFAD